jgi:serine/threonine protein kinase/class 3 adenylate cyclase
MSLDRFRLRTQLGAGVDGISYLAEAADGGSPIEVRDLTASRSVPGRWNVLLPRMRLAVTLRHPAVLQVVQHDLTSAQPFLAMEFVGSATLATTVRATGPFPRDAALRISRSLTSALALAHRLGLSHGRLTPDRVWIDDQLRPFLDFHGTDTGYPCASQSQVGDATEFVPGIAAAGSAGERASDLYNLGRLFLWILTANAAPTGSTLAESSLSADNGWSEMIGRLLAADPADRPTAHEVERWLAGLIAESDQTGDHTPKPDHTAEPNPGDTVDTRFGTSSQDRWPNREQKAEPASRLGYLGRYQLLEKLGEGGQGVVYRAIDPATGIIVAIKMLRADRASNPDVLRRFRKEARLMAEVNNPYVVNLLEYNEDNGVPYLVLEFVAGESVSELLVHTRLDEPSALLIMAGVARGLVEAHDRGIVHRDIKPSNILMLDKAEPEPGSLEFLAGDAAQTSIGPVRTNPEPETITRNGGQAGAFRIKVTDFGLARRIVDSESLAVTAAGALLGTPNYMSPEQWTGLAVDSRTDVYAMGVTLYHMIAGKVPFSGNSTEELRTLHCHQQPVPLETVAPRVSEGVSRVVARAMAKDPDDRYVDATALLKDVDALLHGQPTAIPMHPILPKVDPRKLRTFEFRWDLKASPRQLWPFVTNTDRLDRAIGFPAMRYTTRFEPGRGVRTFAEGRKAGMQEVGEEHPYEWVEPRRMGVLREYSAGPFVWVVSTVELIPRVGGGTTLVHRLNLEPRTWTIRIGSRWGVGFALRKSLGKVYERIDATIMGGSRRAVTVQADAFEPAVPLTRERRERLERLLDRLLVRGIAAGVVEQLGDFLVHAAAQDVARIRPLALAERLGVDPDTMVAACLYSVAEGLLVLHWDLLCPVCRISCDVKDTLRAIEDHAHCTACHVDFRLDFANSIELIFRVHPEIREADIGTYCIGGPAHSPHVLAQIRVAPGEHLELELELGEGSYRLRGPQLPWSMDFQVTSSTAVRRWDLDLGAGEPVDFPKAFRAGGQVLVLTNPLDREMVIRIERTASRSDALTAARAASLALFRELFPGERLAPGRLATVSTVTFLVTEIDAEQADLLYSELGDARAFAVIHDHFERLGDRIRQAGGAVVKTQGESLIAAFNDVTPAVKTALELPFLRDGDPTSPPLLLRAGIHRGTTLAATVNDQLDYFGTTARQAAAILHHTPAGTLVLSQAVASDPEVAALLNEREMETRVIDTELAGHPHLIRISLEADRAGTGAGVGASSSYHKLPGV